MLQSVHGGLERGNIVGVGGRLFVRIRPQHRIEQGCELADGGELGLLVIGNETVDRLYACDLGQLGELLRVDIGGLLVWGQHINRTRPDVRIAPQLKKSRNRLDVCASQVERIEVELQPIKQWETRRDNEPGANDVWDAVALHEPVDRRQDFETHLLRFARRPQDSQQCRNERDTG